MLIRIKIHNKYLLCQLRLNDKNIIMQSKIKVNAMYPAIHPTTYTFV